MLIFINLFYLIFTVTFAGTSRAPAVLDSSCDLNMTITNKPMIEIQLEQCKRVHQCMNGAADGEMPDLKKLEALVCKGDLQPVTTSVPKLEVNKAELNDNSRHEKKVDKEDLVPASSSTVIEK
jgi:hypothetical protein